MTDVEIKAMLTAERTRKVKGPDRSISVVRTKPWITGKQVFRRAKFDAGKGLLNVSFVGTQEDSTGTDADPQSVAESEVVDVGGPRRDYFRILLHDIINNSGLFEGE